MLQAQRKRNNIETLALSGGQDSTSSMPLSNAHQHRSLTSRRGQVQKNPFPLRLVISASVIVFVAANLAFLYHFIWIPSKLKLTYSSSSAASLQPGIQQQQQSNVATVATKKAAGPLSSCEFREYPPHRYYELTASRNKKDDAGTTTTRYDFLTKDTVYIYGEWPILLPIDQSSSTTDDDQQRHFKLCVHQEEWRSSSSNTASPPDVLPFADGTNPSLLSMSRFQKQATASSHVDFFEQMSKHGIAANSIKWLATACMTNSQCRWRDETVLTEAQQHRYRVNVEQEKPDTVRTMILLLNARFETVGQATLHLQRDAPWGKRGQVKALSESEQENERQNPVGRKVFAFDDARLFMHQGQLWISYREGKWYGIENQVLNPVHLEWNSPTGSNDSSNLLSFSATVRASESATLCCGRNMAFMDQPATPELPPLPPLQALTWVDPITVVEVDTTPFLKLQQQQKQNKRRRLMQEQESNESPLVLAEIQLSEQSPAPPSLIIQAMPPLQQEQQTRRRLAAAAAAQNKPVKEKKTHIHGTNAFMVYWPQEDVFLGMGHFHRPNDRVPNEFARFGHHYVHTLFAVRKSKESKGNGDSKNNNNLNDYHLHAMSPEFVIPSFHHADDAEIIQFASGLEIDDELQKLVIGYGINDCEAAVVTIDLAKVKTLLRPVPTPGLQVADLMQPLQ